MVGRQISALSLREFGKNPRCSPSKYGRMLGMFDTRRFEAALKAAKMTARELSSRINFTEPNLSRIRTGRQQPRQPVREAIEKALGLEIGELDIDPSVLPGQPLRLDQLERTVIETMRTLSQHQRERALAYVQGLAGTPGQY